MQDHCKRAILFLSSSKILTPATKAGGTHSPGGEGDGGSIFWKTREIGLPSYNDLSTSSPQSNTYLPQERERSRRVVVNTIKIQRSRRYLCGYSVT